MYVQTYEISNTRKDLNTRGLKRSRCLCRNLKAKSHAGPHTLSIVDKFGLRDDHVHPNIRDLLKTPEALKTRGLKMFPLRLQNIDLHI
jgi:hypothetical protein